MEIDRLGSVTPALITSHIPHAWELDASFNKRPQSSRSVSQLRPSAEKAGVDEAVLPRQIRAITSKTQGGDDLCMTDAAFPAASGRQSRLHLASTSRVPSRLPCNRYRQKKHTRARRKRSKIIAASCIDGCPLSFCVFYVQ